MEALNFLVKKIKEEEIKVFKDGCTLATLRPINKDILPEIDMIVDALTKWRNKAMPFFKTGFIATNERTLNWLVNTVIPSEQKILFLIYVEDKMIGHFGLCNITEDSAELDNAIRGERGGHPDLFKYVEKKILDIAFSKLGVNKIYGRLFSNNFLAMTLHKQFGFQENSRSPLKLLKSKDEWEYIECSKEDANTNVEYVELILLDSSFNMSLFF